MSSAGPLRQAAPTQAVSSLHGGETTRLRGRENLQPENILTIIPQYKQTGHNLETWEQNRGLNIGGLT